MNWIALQECPAVLLIIIVDHVCAYTSIDRIIICFLMYFSKNPFSMLDYITGFTLLVPVEEPVVHTTPVALGATLPPLPKASRRRAPFDVWDHFTEWWC